MAPQKPPARKPETAAQRAGAIILTAVLVFAFALFLRHASHTCPNGVVPGTLNRCK
jgi:hypothetical protein